MKKPKHMPTDEDLYRQYTTSYYVSGNPHPLKASDEIRRRMGKSSKVWHPKMKRALAYAERYKQEWIAKLKAEEEYLLASGWKRQPYEHEEFMGDHDAWISPRGSAKMSRSGALFKQCRYDGHVLGKIISESDDQTLATCSRCGAAYYSGD